MSTYAQIRAEISRLQQQMVEAFRREYPAGAVVTWQRGTTTREVTIVRHHDTRDRVEVETDAGFRFWAHGCDIVGADEEEE